MSKEAYRGWSTSIPRIHLWAREFNTEKYTVHYRKESPWHSSFTLTVNKGIATGAPVNHRILNLGTASIALSASGKASEATNLADVRLICAPVSIIA